MSDKWSRPLSSAEEQEIDAFAEQRRRLVEQAYAEREVTNRTVAAMIDLQDALSVERRRNARLMILAGCLAVGLAAACVGWWAARQEPLVIEMRDPGGERQ